MRTVIGAMLTAIGLAAFSCASGSYDPGETTALSCQDETDNDADGKVDCEDEDCSGFVFCSKREDTAVMCQDTLDNDGDSETDCDDIDCWGFIFCMSEGEDTVPNCQDGEDNDGDSLTDCDDPECQGFLFCQGATEDTADQCDDDVDNDGDQLTDCEDLDCQVFAVCAQGDESTAALCQDGQDNDGDGDTDCFDLDCQGFTFCDTTENETSATRCRDGVDNDWDGKTDCDDPECQGYVFCSTGGESTRETCQDERDNDGDSLTDCDDDGCWAFEFCRHYHGYPLVDAWGETWDGIERPALTFPEAEALCVSLSGRLPTATELYRNNATSGTGDLSDDQAHNPLWTGIASASVLSRVTVRLSDGAVTTTDASVARKFRCVWPDREGDGFDQHRCYGAPGAYCWEFDRFQNVDRQDRPALDYAAAVNECASYGASIPTAGEWGRMIHAGIPNGSDEYLWAAKAITWYNGNYGMPIIRWRDEDAARWQYNNGLWGNLSQGTQVRRFRCVGLARPADFSLPDPACHQSCFRTDDRRSPLLADADNRTEARMAEALATCRAEGGTLPNMADATDLLHAALPAGTVDGIWTTDPVYWHDGNYGHALPLWLDAGMPDWIFSAATALLSPAADLHKVRCVWRPAGPDLPTCQPAEVVEWDGTAFACAPGQVGNSGGQANVVEIVDDFSNAWDGIQREVASYADAQATCEALGAMLPTASEVYAGRYTGNPHDPIGQVTDTSDLWTCTQGTQPGHRAVVRVSDGTSGQAPEDSSQYYRCIWPARRGTVLAANNCYGPPGDECFFTADGILADSYDRVALDVAGAINECRTYGGHLPDLREAMHLLHDGWPNGSDAWIWLSEPVYWYDSNFGYATVRWLDAGTPDWEYAASTTGSLSVADTHRPFRCVYATALR